ncbi:golvesin C-terminal-like domain-containing protein [[Kitasatospora] papulosa]|uniref:golvesin C-terminal-like domain-containing protein n=1 Tax=[Kitasatospora] papulosa TaxID=1464011 RepID=UPI00369B71A6
MRARPKAGRRHRRRAVRTAVVLSTAAALIAALPVGANAAPEPKAPSGAAQGWTGGKTGSGGSMRQPALPEEQRAAVLGKSYTTSDDLAWSTSGDATGFHLLTAARADGYAWRTAATLAEPGFEADSWIGNVCVTGSGKRAVVAYAPRTFTNDQQLMSRGAFTAVVELATGKVTKLPFQASLAYFSPGCGTDETAVFSQFADDRSARNETRVVRVDAATGKAAEPLALAGQVTSAVPYGDDVVAADGNRLVRIDGKGARSTVALTRRIPFQLKADRDGGLVYLDRPAASPSARTKAAAAEDGAVMRVDATAVKSGKGAPSKLATGTLAKMDLTSSADGTVMVTGETRQAVSALPAAVRRPAGAPKDAHASTDGKVLVTAAGWSGDGKNPARAGDTGAERTAMIDLKDLGTGRTAALETRPGGAPHQDAGQKLSPSLEGVGSTASGKRSASLAAAGDPHNPVEAERTCAVARGDVRQQAFQPTPRQVEWAVDQAISNNLNKLVSRPANWKDTGVGSYAPQQLFPLKSLTGGGQIPAQVMLGITAQESNMWQATRYAVPGVTANSLIGNYYGTKYNSDGQIPDPWAIDWSESDCGYGITQVTDNMRASDTGWSSLQQKAVAVDYTANIAAGVNILIEKWNQTKAGGMTIANGDPKYLESWFFALWAYNSGYYAEADASKNKGKWGLGFTNNPANPLWKANRTPFLENASGTDDYSHAAHPQDWPYQEKVLGWAARPISALFKPGDMQAGYRPAWWTTIGDRTALKPPESLFCTSANECDPSKIGPNDSNDPGMGACTRSDLYCWWNKSIPATTWKNCAAGVCGNAIHRFDNTYPEQPDENSYAPRCSGGVPSDALVVDDVPNGIRPSGSANRCPSAVSSAGSFEFTFADSGGFYPGKIDLHQIGAGYSNHFWFTHSRKTGTTDANRLDTTGTWKLGKALNGWSRVMVHIPDHGAHTQQAKYEIDTGSGSFTRTRYVNQKIKANTWVSLGVYNMSGTPRVRLGSQTADGDGSEDVAWDAVAFQPLPAKPKHIVAVLGDSYTSGEGAGDYSPESDADHGTDRWNACRRSDNAWSRKVVLPGTSTPLGQLSDDWSSTAELGFVACSGAMTRNVWNSPFDAGSQSFGEGQFKEINQVNSGVLTPETTLVMLTLGGNDGGGFTNAMMDCAGIGTNCNEDPNFLPKYKGIVDQTMIPNLSSTLSDIALKAPNAQIVLMGYPELLSRTVKCAGSLYYMMPEVAALAELVNHADSQQEKLVGQLKAGGMKIAYANPVDAFVGHAGCDDPEWINKIVIGPNGDGDFHQGDPVTKVSGSCTADWLPEGCLSRESFHPKSDGTTGYANVMKSRLTALGYTGS